MARNSVRLLQVLDTVGKVSGTAVGISSADLQEWILSEHVEAIERKALQRYLIAIDEFTDFSVHTMPVQNDTLSAKQ